MAKKIYTTKLKMAIVRLYLAGDIGLSALANEYHVSNSDIQKWVADYKEHGIAGLYTTYGSYTGDFKLSVIEYMINNKASIREAAIYFNIASYTTIGKWKRIYEEHGKEGLYEDRRGKNKKRRKVKAVLPELEEEGKEQRLLLLEVQRLRMENEYLIALNDLILQQSFSVGNSSRTNNILV